jgi:hypothetical protein
MVLAHSQVRDRKSAQPSARSAHRVGRAAGSVPSAAVSPAAWPAVPAPPAMSALPAWPASPAWLAMLAGALGRRSRLRASTLTAYDAASAATTTAGPARAIRTPPSAGPAILVAESASPYSVFALTS